MSALAALRWKCRHSLLSPEVLDVACVTGPILSLQILVSAAPTIITRRPIALFVTIVGTVKLSRAAQSAATAGMAISSRIVRFAVAASMELSGGSASTATDASMTRRCEIVAFAATAVTAVWSGIVKYAKIAAMAS